MKPRLRIMIGLWIGMMILGSCEKRADYLNWSRKVANYCKYVKYSEESKRYECGPKVGEFYTYIIVHPDYDLPKEPVNPLVAYDGNDNVVMVGGNGEGQIWRMIKFEKWEFVRETKTGMKEVYYDKEEKAFIGLEIGDNKENIKSMAWWSKDGGKSWFRARVSGFQKEEKKASPVLPVEPVVVGPKLPVGGIVEAVGGGYAVAIGKVGGKPAVWRSEDKVPRDWKLTEEFSGAGILPDSLTELSQLKGVEFKGGKFRIRDEEGQGWTYNGTKNEWELTESGGFGGGSGTVGDPYEIASARHLWLLRNHLTSHFELLKDLDLSVVTEREGFNPIGDWRNPFIGTFDGKGKVIRNLRINRPRQGEVGLFGGVGDGGVVKNIGLEDVDLRGGGLIGGLAGLNLGRIEKSYATGAVVGEDRIGGLVGYNDKIVENSYASVDVTGTEYVGGLVGINHYVNGTNFSSIGIGNSYATGTVTGTRNVGVGGLVGYNDRSRIYGKNYWKEGSAAQGVGEGRGPNVERKTDAELKGLDATETGWDATIWNFQAGQYPKLAWQD